MKLLPKKSLGQHFLTSKHVLEQIISSANIQKNETILEIGPGTGILTEALLQTGAKIIAVEKDDRAQIFLKIKFDKEIRTGQLNLIHGDILDEKLLNCPPSADGVKSTNSSPSHNGVELSNYNYAIVANIPYYITGAILQKFLEQEPRPNRMVLLVQKEVAERIVAKNTSESDKNGKESILSISVKAFGIPRIIAKVSKGAFSPPPTVDSAILSITDISKKHFTDKNVEIPRFFDIVRAGFAHKRKFAIRNLETIIPPEKLEIIWQKLQLNPKIRAEDVSLEQWLEICE
ncbi:MAG: 16S rRNA (adenine(1518)-N(6)/adenine(1519)-N(6))-dimethyltransferase RsmA [Candidatus Paceibacterota bacterium]